MNEMYTLLAAVLGLSWTLGLLVLTWRTSIDNAARRIRSRWSRSFFLRAPSKSCSAWAYQRSRTAA